MNAENREQGIILKGLHKSLSEIYKNTFNLFVVLNSGVCYYAYRIVAH